jgi:L-lactate dehydrogenase complex protein LldF
VRLLARNAIGTPMTQYTSHFRAPRAGGELHYVIVDNRRSERLGLKEFWTSLKCIRCGACITPVRQRAQILRACYFTALKACGHSL